MNRETNPPALFLTDRAVARARGRRGLLAAAEWVLLVAGLVLVGSYIAVRAYSNLSQAYYDWSLERTLRGESVTFPEFVRSRVFERQPRPSAKPPETLPTRPKLPAVPKGGLIGRLDIPTVGLSVVVFEGTDHWTLNRGAGHIEGTALPGEPGNFAVAGHRDSFFRALKDIARDDVIVVTAPNGTFRYRIDETRIVKPTDTYVLASRGRDTLTLVTCYPFYFVGHAPKRFIVSASRLEESAAETTPPAMGPGERPAAGGRAN